MNKYDLVADIGGTHSRFALLENGTLVESSIKRLPHGNAESVSDQLERYLAGRKLGAACLAVAGPVSGRAAQLTNHEWLIQSDDIPAENIYLINDLQATAYSLSHLKGPQGPRLAVNLGTGLNAAVLHKIGALWHAPASEAGYMRLPLLDPDENTALRALAERFGPSAMEAVLTGRALPRLHQQLAGATLKAEEISRTWPEPTATLFARVLGAYIGDLALAHLPYGGIWLAGSLGRAAAPLLSSQAFTSTFAKRGPYEGLMSQFAFQVLADDFAPLKGAALYLAQGQAALSGSNAGC